MELKIKQITLQIPCSLCAFSKPLFTSKAGESLCKAAKSLLKIKTSL